MSDSEKLSLIRKYVDQQFKATCNVSVPLEFFSHDQALRRGVKLGENYMIEKVFDLLDRLEVD